MDYILQKPGEIPAGPGVYTECGARGGDVNKPRVVVFLVQDFGKDPRLPPTRQRNRKWRRRLEDKSLRRRPGTRRAGVRH